MKPLIKLMDGMWRAVFRGERGTGSYTKALLFVTKKNFTEQRKPQCYEKEYRWRMNEVAKAKGPRRKNAKEATHASSESGVQDQGGAGRQEGLQA